MFAMRSSLITSHLFFMNIVQIIYNKIEHNLRYKHYVISSKKYLFYFDDGEGNIIIEFLSCKEFLNYYKNFSDKLTRNFFNIRTQKQFLSVFHPTSGLYHMYGLHKIMEYCYFIGEDMYIEYSFVENFNKKIVSKNVISLQMCNAGSELVVKRIHDYLRLKDREIKINSFAY